MLFIFRSGATVVDVILEGWGQLTPWWDGPAASQETKLLVIGLLTKLILVDSQVPSLSFQQDFVGICVPVYLKLKFKTEDSVYCVIASVSEKLVFTILYCWGNSELWLHMYM